MKTTSDTDTIRSCEQPGQLQSELRPAETPNPDAQKICLADTDPRSIRAANFVWRECWSMNSLIYAYTHSEAVGEGLLVELSPFAEQVGFSFAVAATKNAWESCFTQQDAAHLLPEEVVITTAIALLRDRIASTAPDGFEVPFAIILPDMVGHSHRISLLARRYDCEESESLVVIQLANERIEF